MNQLDKLEKRIRALFESSASILPWTKPNDRLVQALSIAIQDLFLNEIPRDQLISPVFIVKLHPLYKERWTEQPDWQSTLSHLFTATAAEYGTYFHSTPAVDISADPTMAIDEIQVQLKESSTPVMNETGVISMPENQGAGGDLDLELVPILLLQGERVVRLEGSVINIGRKSSNHIVINDLRISRTHAQIRKVKDDYIIFDTGSSGGTFINANQIDRHVLRPGDVISLAGYTMIFTCDQMPAQEAGKGITAEIKSLKDGDES